MASDPTVDSRQDSIPGFDPTYLPHVLCVQAYAAIAQQCWQEDPAARPTFEQLVLLLQQLQQQEAALQDEVAAVYEGVVAGWQLGGSSDGAAGEAEQQL